MIHLVVVHGPRQSGKTTFLRALATKANSSNIKTWAVIEESRRDDHGVPLSLAFHSLQTGKIRLLAERESSRPYKPFQFKQNIFDEVLEELKEAARICTLLVIDEIGPYEILEGKGLWPFFQDFSSERPILLAVGIRPDLIEPFLHALDSCRLPYTLESSIAMNHKDTPIDVHVNSILASCQSLCMDLS